MNARMHLNGCHFFAWVYENPVGDNEVRWYEREGEDLALHADTNDCERCTALLNGSASRAAAMVVELPEDTKGAFTAVLVAIARLDAETA